MRGVLAAVVGVVALLTPTAVFGWGSSTHGNIANEVLNYTPITNWLTFYGFNDTADRNTIVSTASGEPDQNTYQNPSWSIITGQQFHANKLVRNSSLTWGLTPFHIGVLLHFGADACVPIGHMPARMYWGSRADDTGTAGAEAGQEAKTWTPPPIVEDPGATYADKVNYHLSHIGAIATDYYNQFQFRSDITEFFDPNGYSTAHFSQALPYAAPLCVTILNDYFQYHAHRRRRQPGRLGGRERFGHLGGELPKTHHRLVACRRLQRRWRGERPGLGHFGRTLPANHWWAEPQPSGSDVRPAPDSSGTVDRRHAGRPDRGRDSLAEFVAVAHRSGPNRSPGCTW